MSTVTVSKSTDIVPMKDITDFKDIRQVYLTPDDLSRHTAVQHPFSRFNLSSVVALMQCIFKSLGDSQAHFFFKLSVFASFKKRV